MFEGDGAAAHTQGNGSPTSIAFGRNRLPRRADAHLPQFEPATRRTRLILEPVRGRSLRPAVDAVRASRALPMSIRTFAAAVLCLCALSPSALAQNFSYANFNSTAGLTLNGSAVAAAGALNVAPAVGSARGSVYRTAPINVAAGFEATFNFSMTSTGLGADGMAFVIHNDPRGVTALGGDGSTMGYGNQLAHTPIANSLVIELDTYDAGSPWFDPDANHVSIQTNGIGDNNAYHSLSIGAGSPLEDLNNGQTHKLIVRYTPGLLRVFLNGSTTPLVSANYSFASGGTWLAGGAVGGLNLINGTDAYVGFSAACGGLTQDHRVLSWSWIGASTPPTSFCTAGTSTSGCTPSISASAHPSVAGVSPCTISIANLEGQKSGLVFYSIDNTGFTPLSWSAGSSSFLCVKPPTQRTPAQGSGGTVGQCDGAIALNWNTFQTTFVGSLGQPWIVGEQVFAQGWYRDPPAVKTTNLTNAVQLTYVP